MFILRQKRFLAFCLVTALGFAVLLVSSTLRNHHDAPALLVTMAAVGFVAGLGAAFLAALVVFAVYRVFFTVAPAIELAPYEDVLASMPANSYLDGEARGGTLFVTQRRLIFLPHRLNFQLQSTFMEWNDIAGLAIPAAPPAQTSLTIELKDGGQQRLVVYNQPQLVAYFERLLRLDESQRATRSASILGELGLAHFARAAVARTSPRAFENIPDTTLSATMTISDRTIFDMNPLAERTTSPTTTIDPMASGETIVSPMNPANMRPPSPSDTRVATPMATAKEDATIVQEDATIVNGDSVRNELPAATIVTAFSPLAFAEGLKTDPPTPLITYLRRLAALLEEAYALKFGFFKGRRIDPDAAVALGEQIRQLAELAFARALRVRPGEVVRWLAQLNDLQKPAMIDIAAWTARAAVLPPSTGTPPLPAPSAELQAAVAALAAYQPDKVGLPTEIDLVEQAAETSGLPAEQLAFYRLATHLQVTFGSHELSIPPLQLDYKSIGGLELWNWRSKKNPWSYSYRFQSDGSIAQTNWSRTEGGLHKLEPPQRVADSLAQLLTMALAAERFDGPDKTWTPGPILPMPGEKSQPPVKIKREKRMLPVAELRVALEDLINRHRFNPYLQFTRSASPPSAEQIVELQQRLAFPLPQEYIEFLRAYGWGHFAVKEEVWPRPQAGDAGPGWSFEYGVRLFGVGDDVPDALDIEREAEYFAEENRDDDQPRLLPFSTVETSGEYHCFDGDGDIFLVYEDEATPHAVEDSFLELLDRQLTGLTERLQKKLASG